MRCQTLHAVRRHDNFSIGVTELKLLKFTFTPENTHLYAVPDH